MSAWRIAAALGLLGFVGVAPLAAQGLGDLAARERAKRTQTKKPEAKVFTNDDLDAGKPPGAKSETDAASAAPPPESQAAAPAELPPVDERQQQERAYLDAIRAAQAELRGAENRIRELSAKLNPMSTTYIYGSGGSNDANEELRVREELRQAEPQLLAARQAVATANQNLQDFRQGRPVGSSDSDR